MRGFDISSPYISAIVWAKSIGNRSGDIGVLTCIILAISLTWVVAMDGCKKKCATLNLFLEKQEYSENGVSIVLDYSLSFCSVDENWIFLILYYG